MRAEIWMDQTPEEARAKAQAFKRAYVIGQLLEIWPEMSDETRVFLEEERKRANALAQD